VTHLGREAAEVEALVTDVYLDALLAGAERAARPRDPRAIVDAAVRLASSRLTRDLPRFHPSFRFEERLALRLAERAASMRLPAAAGAEGVVVPLLSRHPAPDPAAGDEVDAALEPASERAARGRAVARPILLGGAVAASALSLAGAAFVAWRRNRGAASPMARAARAAHAARASRILRPTPGRGGPA